MTHKEIEEILLNYPNTWLDKTFGPDTSVYKVGEPGSEEAKIFATIANDSKPLRLSLKCDELLAKQLREDYETILPGFDLNKKNWNTILMTGQVPDEEIKSLIILSYNLASNEN